MEEQGSCSSSLGLDCSSLGKESSSGDGVGKKVQEEGGSVAAEVEAESKEVVDDPTVLPRLILRILLPNLACSLLAPYHRSSHRSIQDKTRSRCS